jgi:hypothetical protein
VALLLLLLLGSVASGEVIQSGGRQTTAKTAVPIRISVSFIGVDQQGYLLLKYGAVSLRTRLKGLKLRPGAAGVLGVLIPTGTRLEAQIVEKGSVQTVILTKQGVNLGDQLLIQGVAEAVR